MRRRIVRTLLLVVALAAGGAAAATAAAASPGHATRVYPGHKFPDPGFAKFGSHYYLYATGGYGSGWFHVLRSSSSQRGYTSVGAAMHTLPAWVGKAKDGGYHMWAPQVFQATDSKLRTIYVMYFTAHKAGWGANCIGVAYSHYPDHGYGATGTTICAKTNYDETIDPTMYRTADGKRWLVYKVNHANQSDFHIKAVQMNSRTGMTRVAGVRSKTLISPGSKMEAPSVLRHGGKVWIFTSRGSYTDCTYSTDVWAADTFYTTFRRVKTIMSSASTGLCGPGGAAVIPDGSTTRIAFHSYVSGIRQVWVGSLRWNSVGNPYLY